MVEVIILESISEKESQEFVQYVDRRVTDLLKDLSINNPSYSSAFTVGENEVIELLAGIFSLNPMWFAKAYDNGEYVRFDLTKIEKYQAKLHTLLQKNE